MKSGLVLEGGAMRGLFTAGVIDVFLENDITFDLAIGVSAGAAFGVNLKSEQKGRVLRYNMRFAGKPYYASWKSWRRSGNLYAANFCYHILPDKLDVFDKEKFMTNPMDFWCVATDAATGEPVYHQLHDAGYVLTHFDDLLREFDQKIGLDRLLVVHVNDSKNERGAHKDRHENIGYGYIGFDTLNTIVHHPQLKDVPKILETPYIDGKAPYREEINMFVHQTFNNGLK